MVHLLHHLRRKLPVLLILLQVHLEVGDAPRDGVLVVDDVHFNRRTCVGVHYALSLPGDSPGGQATIAGR